MRILISLTAILAALALTSCGEKAASNSTSESNGKSADQVGKLAKDADELESTLSWTVDNEVEPYCPSHGYEYDETNPCIGGQDAPAKLKTFECREGDSTVGEASWICDTEYAVEYNSSDFITHYTLTYSVNRQEEDGCYGGNLDQIAQSTEDVDAGTTHDNPPPGDDDWYAKNWPAQISGCVGSAGPQTD